MACSGYGGGGGGDGRGGEGGGGDGGPFLVARILALREGAI